MPLNFGFARNLCSTMSDGLRNVDARQRCFGLGYLLFKGFLLIKISIVKLFGVVVISQSAIDDLASLCDIGKAVNGDTKPKTVEELRTQFPLFRVHCANQNKARSMTELHAFTFDHVHPG